MKSNSNKTKAINRNPQKLLAKVLEFSNLGNTPYIIGSSRSRGTQNRFSSIESSILTKKFLISTMEAIPAPMEGIPALMEAILGKILIFIANGMKFSLIS